MTTPEIAKVKKRDGSIADFEQTRVTKAIYKALTVTGEGDEKTAEKLSDRVVKILNHRFSKREIPDVEQIQDIVEEVLMLEELTQTAKAYIIYREQRRRMREAETIYDEAVEILDKYINEIDWQVKENANMAYSLQGLNNYGVSTLTKRYWLNKIYPQQIREAMASGDFHIHDLDFLGAYCCGWDLYDLLKRGFGGVKGKVESKPPKHLQVALGQVVNFFYTLQGEVAGAVAFSNFDTLLAPFIRYDKLEYKQVKQAMQEFLFGCAVPTRVGFQCLSQDTQILSPEGWKSHNEVQEGDVVYTFNLQTKQIEQKNVSFIFQKDYQGLMYNLKNRSQDQLISPNHRVVRQAFNAEHYVLEPIEKILELKSPIAVPVRADNTNSDFPVEDEQLKLLAWTLAEGTIEKDGSHRVSIYQSQSNKENYQEIIGLLDHFNFDYSQREQVSLGTCMHIRLKPLSSKVIHGWIESTRKRIPDFIYKLSQRQARLFLDVFVKADGWVEKYRQRITTTDENLLHGLEALAVLAGYNFSVMQRMPQEGGIGKKLQHILTLTETQNDYIMQINKVDYQGVIWSVHTDNETVIAKRNGQVFITGNTPFSNITVDVKPSPSYVNQPVIIGGEPQKETYGEFEEEMKIFNKAFFEAMMEGDKNGRVFSVDADCLCPIKNSEKIKLVKIGEYIDKLMEKRKPVFIKENNCEVSDVRDLGIKCLGLKGQKIDWQQVNFLVRHPFECLLQVQTQGGFNIKLSPSHSVFILKDGQICNVKALNLQKGDYLISPKTIPPGENKSSAISLVEEFIKKQKTGGIYVGAVLKNGEDYKETRTVLHKRNYGKKEYEYPRGVAVFPLNNIVSDIKEFDFSNAELNLAGSALKIKNILPISPEIVEFLGWYCAEGSAEKGAKYGGISLGLNLAKERQTAEYIVGLVEKIWPGLPVVLREIKERNLVEVRIHSKLLRRVITEVFELGNGNRRKVPQIIFELPDEMKKIFLNAYFQGDGWLTKDIIATSISRELIYGVSTLLKQLGIFHTLTEYQWEERPRWRVNIFRNRDLKIKDSHTISKIPIKESGLEGVVEMIMQLKPHYQDSLGRNCENTKNGVFHRFGIDYFTSDSTSVKKAQALLHYARELGVKISDLLRGVEEDNFSFFRVKKVEETKTSNGMVYDFSTESESFVADQLLVHNTFPIPTVNITSDFPWDEPFLEPMWLATAKYGINYFANFIQSDMKPEDVRSMCKLPSCQIIYKNAEGEIAKTEIRRIVDDFLARGNSVEILSNGDFYPVKDVIKLKLDNEDILRITLDNGLIDKMTLDHPSLIIKDGKLVTVASSELNVGDEFPIAKRPYQGELGDFELGRMLGLYIGDGWLSHNDATVNFVFNKKERILVDFVSSLAMKRFSARVSEFVDEKHNYCRVSIASKALAELMKEYARGKNSLEKRINSKTFARHIDFRRGVVVGIIESDGFVHKKLNYVALHSSNKKLVYDILVLFRSLGLNTTFFASRNRTGPISKIGYTLRLGGDTPTWLMDYFSLRKGNNLKYKDYGDFYGVKIKEIKKIKYSGYVYDFEIDSKQHIFQLANGIMTHNCCRLRISNKELLKKGGGFFGANPLTGSLGVVTINASRIGYLSKTKKEFFERLERVMDLAKESLEIKRKTVEDFMRKGLYPYSRYYLETVEKMRSNYYGNHFSTIGILGMNECLLNFMGEDIGSDEGRKFTLEVMDFMRERIVKYQEETNNLYNLESTPAEGASYRLALKDKEKYPEIITAGTNETPYYTNSTQLPVNYTDDVFKAIELQDEIQCKYTGGVVLHLFIGEQIRDVASMKNLIKKIFSNYKLPYITLTPTFSICPSHGYLLGEHWKCPKCIIEQPCEVYSRIVGYIRPVQQWHKGKVQEFKERKTFRI